MRTCVQGAAAVAGKKAHLIHVRSDIEEALSAQEMAVLGPAEAAGQTQRFVQRRDRIGRLQLNAPGTAFRPIAERERNGLQDGRFSGAILPDKEGHVGWNSRSPNSRTAGMLYG